MSYSQISSHRSMVFDEHRNELYAKAIRKLVNPDSVVLDLGAGVGILGLIAAAAGAKRVYLVEPEPVVQIAREVAKANGLADRIVVMEGRIEDVELPEKVDLILSVFTGNLLYSEDLLPSLFHARDRYLKPEGRLVPDFAELLLAPVSAPELHAKYIGRWSEPNMGMDFTAARRIAANEILWLGREEFKAERLGIGQVVSAIDMMRTTHADCMGETLCRIDRSGLCHGLLGWIRIRLDDAWLSSDPYGPEVHWSPVMLPLDPPLALTAGEEIGVGLQRPVRGDWTWSVRADGGSQRHSSFLSRLDGPSRLRKLAADSRPGLGKQGAIALKVLMMLQAGKSNREIAEALAPGKTVADVEEAMQIVQRLVLRYADKA